MIDRELIPHSYKGPAIGIVTARSVFREFGAQIIVGGKRIIDDYEVAKLKAEGAVEGELADPNDSFKPGEEYNQKPICGMAWRKFRVSFGRAYSTFASWQGCGREEAAGHD